jgi:hypothetical protein
MLGEYLPSLNLLTRLSLGSIGILVNELREGLTRGTPPLATTYVSHHIAMLARENLIAAKLLQTLASHQSLSAPEWFPGFIKSCLSELHDDMMRYTDEVPYDNYDNELAKIEYSIEENDWQIVGNKPIKAGTVSLIFELVRTSDNARGVGKVVRTGVREKLDQSILEIKPLVQLLSYWSDAGDVEAVAEEIFSSLKQQTHLKDEAANCERFGELCKNVDGLCVPEVYEVISNDFVIFEYLDGKSVAEIGRVSEETRKEWSKIIIKSFIVTAGVEGEVHGDMHAGNFLFNDASGGVGLLDFGVVYSASIEEKQRVQNTIDSLIEKTEGDIELVDWISEICIDGFLIPQQTINSLDEAARGELKERVSVLLKRLFDNNSCGALFDPEALWQEVRSTQGCEELRLNAYGMKLWHALTSGIGVLLTLCDGDYAKIREVITEATKEIFKLDLLNNSS